MTDVHDYQRTLERVVQKVKVSGFEIKSESLMLSLFFHRLTMKGT